MHFRYYRPYPYYRRYYNINPYFYRRYYPFYNVIDGQYANINQDIVNYGDMTDVIQDADVYQSMASDSDKTESITVQVNQTTQSPFNLPQ